MKFYFGLTKENSLIKFIVQCLAPKNESDRMGVAEMRC